MTAGLDMVEAIVDPLPARPLPIATGGPIAAGDLGGCADQHSRIRSWQPSA
jgi:hypothetical protein